MLTRKMPKGVLGLVMLLAAPLLLFVEVYYRGFYRLDKKADQKRKILQREKLERPKNLRNN
jgi:hypothetical protein